MMRYQYSEYYIIIFSSHPRFSPQSNYLTLLYLLISFIIIIITSPSFSHFIIHYSLFIIINPSSSLQTIKCDTDYIPSHHITSHHPSSSSWGPIWRVAGSSAPLTCDRPVGISISNVCIIISCGTSIISDLYMHVSLHAGASASYLLSNNPRPRPALFFILMPSTHPPPAQNLLPPTADWEGLNLYLDVFFLS